MIANIAQYRSHQHSNVHKRKPEASSGKTQDAFIAMVWKSDEPPLPRSLLVDSTFTARWTERTNRDADPEQTLREQSCQPHDARYLAWRYSRNSVRKFGLPLESSGSIELPVSQLRRRSPLCIHGPKCHLRQLFVRLGAL